MDHNDKLLKVYDQVMDQVAEAIHTADIALQPTMEEIIGNATELAHQAQDITLKDAKEFSTYLQRDISHALDGVQKNGKELKDWLNFDLEIAEDKFLDIISKAADKTWLTLNNLEQSNRLTVIYKTGEITAPGILDCTACSQSMQFNKSTHIPPCPKCHKTEFTRKPL